MTNYPAPQQSFSNISCPPPRALPELAPRAPASRLPLLPRIAGAVQAAGRGVKAVGLLVATVGMGLYYLGLGLLLAAGAIHYVRHLFGVG